METPPTPPRIDESSGVKRDRGDFEDDCEALNNVLQSIFNGPKEDSDSGSSTASTTTSSETIKRIDLTEAEKAELEDLDILNEQIKNYRNQRNLLRQQVELNRAKKIAQAQEDAEVKKQRLKSEMEQYKKMLDELKEKLERSNTILPLEQRMDLSKNLMGLISNYVTNYEIIQELEQHRGPERNLEELFNAAIQIITSMASYGYENGPQIAAKIGSLLAGTIIMAGSIYATSQTVPDNCGALILLSKYMQSATTTAGGLYFLQRGGVDVTGMLEGIGGRTRECLRDGCQRIKNSLTDFLQAGIHALENQYDVFSDNYSTESKQSGETNVSNAGASVAILDLGINTSDEDKIEQILDGSVPEIGYGPIPDSIAQFSQGTNISGLTGDGSQGFDDSQGYGFAPPNSLASGINGGRKRKSRRHMKSKRTRKGRKGRRGKGRMTKKGRKHHRTLKRYRSKGRR